jgi:hypothetical protein
VRCNEAKLRRQCKESVGSSGSPGYVATGEAGTTVLGSGQCCLSLDEWLGVQQCFSALCCSSYLMAWLAGLAKALMLEAIRGRQLHIDEGYRSACVCVFPCSAGWQAGAVCTALVCEAAACQVRCAIACIATRYYPGW